ncbi:hypothetical protein J2Y86_002692 [Pseudomonas migulae]|uniref:hypothetical protein n=1 Tax=Pseudomonas migulae TaxID=78543 RepID=UPI0020A0EE13|nr:hypothetical protein [Pseudomonas migulae]MCP1497985.1 hypothetical protein [Pseudomonas migulae]
MNRGELKQHFNAQSGIKEILKTRFLVLYNAIFIEWFYCQNNNSNKKKNLPMLAAWHPARRAYLLVEKKNTCPVKSVQP